MNDKIKDLVTEKNEEIKSKRLSSSKDDLEVSDLNKSLDELNTSLMSSIGTNSSTTVTSSEDPKLSCSKVY